MSSPATVQLDYVTPDRAAINRANSQHSTGPRTEAGKQRVSLNALRHGLTAKTAVLPSEDPAAFERHCREFREDYQPANSTESQLVQELADTSWRLNRIPLIEAKVLTDADPLADPQPAIQALSMLGLHSARLSRQFQKALDQLRQIQYDRRHQERRDLRDAADILEFHKYKGIPWDPADDGFVFTKDQVERHARRLMRQIEAQHIGCARFDIPPQIQNPDRRF